MQVLLPKVSVIIPTYNYGNYIEEAVVSVLQQDYPQHLIELIVVDDGSTDDTEKALAAYVANGSVQYIWQPNSGKASATRKGVEMSTGEIIFNLDADDLFLNDKIKNTVTIFADPTIVHVASPARLVYQQTGKTGEENLPADILGKPLDGRWLLHRFYTNNMLFGGGSTYAARAAVLRSIDIPPAVDMYIDEFLLLAILPFGKSYFSPKPLSVWRIHSNNYSGETTNRANQLAKADRLIRSSAAVLLYLQQQSFDKKIIDIYRLQDASRFISFKEYFGTKKLSDIVGFMREIVAVRPSLKVIKKYKLLNRLLPLGLFRLLKKIQSSQPVLPGGAICLC